MTLDPRIGAAARGRWLTRTWTTPTGRPTIGVPGTTKAAAASMPRLHVRDRLHDEEGLFDLDSLIVATSPQRS